MKNLILFILLPACISCSSRSSNQGTAGDSVYEGTGYITKGRAQVIVKNLLECDHPITRVSAIGKINDSQNQTWVVPGTNHYQNAIKAFDLYNDCIPFTPHSLSEIDMESVPVAVIDSNGEVITGYIFADNYFELYINGQLIAVDPIPYTPFNSSIVKFKVTKPYLIAMKLIDWEEDLGLGSENYFGAQFHAGDGGVIASFSDGTVTNEKWKAQTFYTAPVKDLSCLKEIGTIRISADCNSEDSRDGSSFYGVHWKIPKNSYAKTLDDSAWPHATTYTEEEIGVEGKKAYTNFIERFSGAGAKFIWSTNVVLDNEVIARYWVK